MEQTKPSNKTPLDTISVPQEIETHYKDTETLSIISLIEINLDIKKKHHIVMIAHKTHQ